MAKINWRQIYDDLNEVNLRVYRNALWTLEDLIDRNIREIDPDGIEDAIAGLKRNISNADAADAEAIQAAIDALHKELAALKRGRHARISGCVAQSNPKQGEQTMNRNRRRRRGSRRPSGRRSLVAEIEALEKRLAADQEQIDQWGDELAQEESAIVDEGTGMDLVENEHQNELAMDNWPSDADNMKWPDGSSMSASEREMVAMRLLKMANILLSSD
jgi:hypothetical protein